MLSLRRFDSAVASSIQSVSTPRLRLGEYTASERANQFATQPEDNLPVFIASFSQPLHVDSSVSDNDPNAIVDVQSQYAEAAALTAEENHQPRVRLSSGWNLRRFTYEWFND